MLKHWGAGYKRGHFLGDIDLLDWLNIVDPSFSFPYDRVAFCFLGFRSAAWRWTGPRENAQTQESVDTEG